MSACITQQFILVYRLFVLISNIKAKNHLRVDSDYSCSSSKRLQV